MLNNKNTCQIHRLNGKNKETNKRTKNKISVITIPGPQFKAIKIPSASKAIIN